MDLLDSAKIALLKGLAALDIAAGLLPMRPMRNPLIVPGDVHVGSRPMLCVFSHYDRDGLVDDYVEFYLRSLDEVGCEIIFVSTAPRLDTESIARVKRRTSRILIRENIGYDFGSWRDGLAACDDLSRYERVILANDSVYGPIHSLQDVFGKMSSCGAEVWGITDSPRYERHLQSYFLAFERPVVNSEIFRGFWRDLRNFRFRRSVIVQCELGLSRRMARAGFKLGAFCEHSSLAGELHTRQPGMLPRRVALDPTQFAWKTLVAKRRSPFIKVRLLRDNPKDVDDIDQWEPTVRASSDYDIRLIRRHLERMAGPP